MLQIICFYEFLKENKLSLDFFISDSAERRRIYGWKPFPPFRKAVNQEKCCNKQENLVGNFVDLLIA